MSNAQGRWLLLCSLSGRIGYLAYPRGVRSLGDPLLETQCQSDRNGTIYYGAEIVTNIMVGPIVSHPMGGV